jgi:ATP-dependent RNA helicase RhlE
MSFESLGLSPALVRALAEIGYATPTPIQSEAIPLALAGHDLLGGAQTGTGKTAAFVLPMLDRLAAGSVAGAPRKIRALVLTPTRELAVQVHDSIKTYGKHAKIASTCIYGGAGMVPQIDAMRRGVDVLVATPGRLIDHLERGTARLGEVELLVLDEADRMLDMGFLPAIKRILNRLPSKRQTMLFSATFEDSIKKLALEFMKDPREVQIAGRNAVAEMVTHIAHPVDGARKRDLLVDILSERWQVQILVFG